MSGEPHASRGRPVLPHPVLMLVTEPGPRLAEIVTEAVKGGVNVVQFRNRSQVAREMHIAATVEAAKRIHGRATAIFNGYPGMVWEALQPSGWQLPEDERFDGYRKAIQAHGLVGRSVHSVESAQRAEADGADYVVAGTIFASQSHPEVAPQGLDFLRAVCAAAAIPVIAIGGVTPENAPDCLRAGAAGVAVLSPIMRAADPGAVAERYWKALATD